MKILGLEPYYGGSHRAFLDGWVGGSRHGWELLTLSPQKWKWRMRHSAVTFAEQVKSLSNRPGVLFCSDMLNLAEFKGLCGDAIRDVPTVIYFHENQLTYPNRFESERDYQFVMTNMTSALAADQVWFNSAFHRDEFCDELDKFLKRMPKGEVRGQVDKIRAKSKVYPPGIAGFSERGKRDDGPCRILWAARWEHDKNAEDFFAAMKVIKDRGLDFRLSVVGEQYCEVPEIFDWAKKYFAEHIDRWGYQDSRSDYESTLTEADVTVSTANHEFFGLSVVEAIAAGAYPMLPRRLSYPQITSGIETVCDAEFLYDGSVDGLVIKLAGLIGRLDDGKLWAGDSSRGVKGVSEFTWGQLTSRLDDGLEAVR